MTTILGFIGGFFFGYGLVSAVRDLFNMWTGK